MPRFSKTISLLKGGTIVTPTFDNILTILFITVYNTSFTRVFEPFFHYITSYGNMSHDTSKCTQQYEFWTG